MAGKPGKARLADPHYRQLALDQIRRQRGMETGVWDIIGIKEGTYYTYKRRHKDYAAAVEAVRQEFAQVVYPYDDRELQEIAIKVLRDYITGGCKTKRLRRVMDATLLVNPDGSPKLDSKGQPRYEYTVKQVVEDIYDNGINLKAYEKVVPEERLTERTIKFCLASMIQDIQEQPLSDSQRLFLYDYLRGFKERAFLELAASS
jgi:hypothetical protein